MQGVCPGLQWQGRRYCPRCRHSPRGTTDPQKTHDEETAAFDGDGCHGGCHCGYYRHGLSDQDPSFFPLLRDQNTYTHTPISKQTTGTKDRGGEDLENDTCRPGFGEHMMCGKPALRAKWRHLGEASMLRTLPMHCVTCRPDSVIGTVSNTGNMLSLDSTLKMYGIAYQLLMYIRQQYKCVDAII